MTKIEELKKYLTHEFSSGSYTGEDYRTFQTKYINYLKAICRENHWQLVNVGKNHYCFSAFIKSAENKCIYISISDVRYFTNEWYGHILIRTAKDKQDCRGGADVDSFGEVACKISTGGSFVAGDRLGATYAL